MMPEQAAAFREEEQAHHLVNIAFDYWPEGTGPVCVAEEVTKYLQARLPRKMTFHRIGAIIAE
jgi:hypothetical protein